MTVNSTVWPGRSAVTICETSSAPATGSPAIATIRSPPSVMSSPFSASVRDPPRSPACAAGVPSSTRVTSAPRSAPRSKAEAMPGVTSWVRMPMYA